MGLFGRRSSIEGTAQIVSCSRHAGEGRWQNCRMHLVVQIDGREPYAAEAHQIAPRKKWPQPGMTVPVTVDDKDPSKVKVDFDAMPTNDERARQIADEQASSMTRQPPAGAPADLFGGVVPGQINIIGDISQVPPDKLAKIEQMTGMDLDGDGTVGGASRSANASTADDRVGQLERLAQLRASGALTEAEFQQEKRRLLGS
jgi:hypothetical protein